MSATEHPEAIAETPAKPQPGPYGFLARVAALITAALGTVVAFVVAVPEANDYARASNLKHDALAAHDHKIVLVGGSNLAYGIDSPLIERITDCPVVNMGFNGFLGIRFMLAEVKPYLHNGDTVVIAFEHETYARPADGSADSLLVNTKTNPATLSALSQQQFINVALRYPYVAHQKLMRILGDATRDAGQALGLAQESDATLIRLRQIESLEGFNANGDLESHLDVDWPFPPSEEGDLPAFVMTEEAFPLIENFVHEMNARGVRVLISYSAAERAFYEKHRAAIESWDAQFRANPAFIVPRPPSDYVFDASMHFDTVYHLDREGRAIRSRMLADDIVNASPGGACSPTQESSSP